MPRLGAHMSIAGGYYKAVDAAAELRWTSSSSSPRTTTSGGPSRSATGSVGVQRAAREERRGHPLSHSSYLINLAAPSDELWQKSIESMVVELERAEQLGIAYVVMHPGAFTTSSEEIGLARIAAGLDEIHRLLPKAKAQVLLENTAGQGSNLGWKFEQLAAILAQVKAPERLGVCIDTCHAFAAGYPLIERREYLATIRALDEAVGLDKIRAFHLNDSKRELGSRVDRHEHIGHGHLGLEPFRHLLERSSLSRRFRCTWRRPRKTATASRGTQ
jgi:deoxyribonuclease IV